MSKINDQSLWNNPAIEETIKNTDPEKYYKYQKMAQSLFDKSNINDPHIINIEAATQIKFMLRDGLNPSLLDNNEKELYISTFGQESFDEFLIESSIDDDNSQLSPTQNDRKIKNISQKIVHAAAKKRPKSNHKEQRPNASKRLALGP
jgi:hypothetical protein